MLIVGIAHIQCGERSFLGSLETVEGVGHDTLSPWSIKQLVLSKRIIVGCDKHTRSGYSGNIS